MDYCSCLFLQECWKCNGVLEKRDIAVIAPKFGNTVCWHVGCFTCCKCEELLVDLSYCVKDGRIYCERHYAELCKPRCAYCDEVFSPFMLFAYGMSSYLLFKLFVCPVCSVLLVYCVCIVAFICL